jgi:S-DNA-T family DNA segregation ATPase FtsK/SpoIIIE
MPAKRVLQQGKRRINAGESRARTAKFGSKAAGGMSVRRGGILHVLGRGLRSFANRNAVFAIASVLLLCDLFLAAAVFTDWTGLLGETARNWMIGLFGGGVLIILLYLGYVLLSVLVGRDIPQFFAQTVGTVSLYVCSALILGLLDLTRPGAPQYLFLQPGTTGRSLSEWLFRNVGPLGTTMTGVFTITLTLLCYGFNAPFLAAYGALINLFSGLSSRRARRHAVSKRDETVAGEPGSGTNGQFEPGREYSDGDCAGEPEEGSGDEPKGGGEDMPELPLPVDIVAVDEIEYEIDGVFLPAGQFPPPPEIYGAEHDYGNDISAETARPWGERIIESLSQFGIDAELADILLGPTVIQFRIQPLPGVKVNRIVALSNDLAMALAVASLRVEAPIPGHPYVGIEIPNPKRRGITLRSILEEDEFQFTDKTLPLPMGVTINGDPLVVGLEEMPHLLVAGTTGSGKSVFVNGCIVGLCSMRRPDELKMVLVDPKRVEMAVYEKLPHLLTPPVTNSKKAVHVLGWAVREMERRYTCCAAVKVRNLDSFNESALPKDRLPHIVIVVDELADLMMTAQKEVEEYICRLAQMARAVGIHLMLATQRPSVNVITGLIKSNVPARVAFTLPSMMDSRTILDCGGAEKLLGKGDMLFTSTQSPKPMRVQSPWIDERSISRWIDYLVNMFGEPIYTDIDDQSDAPSGIEESGGFDDALLDEAVKIVISSGIASASGLQKRLRVGYPRAGRLVDMMETAGIIGPADGARAREILVDEEDASEILERLREGN